MGNGLLKASVRSKPATDPLAPSAFSLTYLRMQAYTPHTAFATATSAILAPLSHLSGVAHRTHNPSHRPCAHRTATTAGLITPTVVPGSRRRPVCKIMLRADRRRALAADPGASSPAEFSCTIRSTIIIQEGTEKRGLYPRCGSARVSRIPRVSPAPATTEGDAQRPRQSLGACTTGHRLTGAIRTLSVVPQNASTHTSHSVRHRLHGSHDASVASLWRPTPHTQSLTLPLRPPNRHLGRLNHAGRRARLPRPARMQHLAAGGPTASACRGSWHFRPCRVQWYHQKHNYRTRRHRKAGFVSKVC